MISIKSQPLAVARALILSSWASIEIPLPGLVLQSRPSHSQWP